MAKKRDLDTPQKVRTPMAELEVLARVKGSVEWTIMKRWMNRYVQNLMKTSFNLPENASNFKARHAEYAGQALGLKTFVRVVERAGKKLEKMEKKENA